MISRASHHPDHALLFALLLALGGCADKIVYRDRTDFDNPPSNSGGFLGFSRANTTQTVCGNCHVGKQTTWQNTAHARAWGDLQNSGHSRPECESCHSVSSLGNVVEDVNVGWVSTQNPRYQNVQCESCHGPGFSHVLDPDVSKPLAPLKVAANLTRGCGECHSGSHQPFAEEWGASRHGKIPTGSRATSTSCTGCHEARGVLAQWGVNTVFMEKGDPAESMPIVCTVCHDPHNAANPNQLRFPIDEPSLQGNLCMKCHYRRAQPELDDSHAPHSPQGPLLLGEAGWFPPNFQYPPKSVVGSHGTDRNPKLCATCHVNSYTIADQETGAFNFRATGHRFDPIPCVDANGIPTGATACDLSERSFRACVDGCHLTESAARSAYIASELDIERLVNVIKPLIARIPASEFSTSDDHISTGEGSKFNMELAEQRGSKVHNPFLVRGLLNASIEQIRLDYGITSAAAPASQPPRQ